MPSKMITGEKLPPGWKVSETVKKQVGTFKYYLNDKSILKKLKNHAIDTHVEELPVKDKTRSFQFSTGAYILAVGPLIKFWKKCEGNFIEKTDTDGLSVLVKQVATQTDAGGRITGYIVRLEVEGENVTITPYDTTVYLRVQGGIQQKEYTERALIPYLKAEINK